MSKSKIQVVDQNQKPIGFIEMFGFLPTFLIIDNKLYQRYGQVSNYRYVLEPEVFIPNKGELEIVPC